MTKAKKSESTTKKSAKDSKPDFSASVMESIKSEDVKMHSKAYFVFLSVVSAASIFLTSVMSAIFINLTFRDIDFARDGAFRSFGPAAEDEFVAAFPWLLTGLAIIAVVSTLALARRLEFSYKHKSYMFFGAVIGVILAMGFSMSALGLNKHIEKAEPLSQLQTLKKRSENKLMYGEVVEVSDEYLILETPFEKSVKVELDEETFYGGAAEMIEVGDEIGVYGEKYDGDDEDEYKDDYIKAEGIGRKPPRAPRFENLRRLQIRVETFQNVEINPQPAE